MLVGRRRLGVVVAALLALAATPARATSTRYGALDFPKDEHPHYAGWDYWWGAAQLEAESGNRYVVGLAYTSFDGDATSGYQLFPLQGPYKGQSVMSMDGPVEWGHPEQPAGRIVDRMSVYSPATELVHLDAYDSSDGMKLIDRWERTSLASGSYRMLIDQTEAKVHPSGAKVLWKLDLRAQMRMPPLLDGGTGRWYYHVPQDYGYPSRGFQYMQAAERLTGTLDLQQPDGSVLHEHVMPAGSTLTWTHESDPPEDIPGGLALAA